MQYSAFSVSLFARLRGIELAGSGFHIPFVMQEPQLFKLVLGGTLGLLVTPVIAMLSLAAKGRQHAEHLQGQNSRCKHVYKEAQSATTVV